MVCFQESGYIADKIVKAEKRIKAYPYDTEAWSVLIRDAQVHFISLYKDWCMYLVMDDVRPSRMSQPAAKNLLFTFSLRR